MQLFRYDESDPIAKQRHRPFVHFFGCKLLARLVLKEGLERIGVDAFYGCESWTSEVETPSAVKVIE
eukprot:scaffold6093_cov58-Cylindrotheca_fusiformis.AAC.3